MKARLLPAALALLARAALAQDPFPLPPKDWPHPVMDHERFGMLLLDRLEYRARSGDDGWAWAGEAWWGGDRHRLWLKSQGEGAVRGPGEHGELQALYARRVSPYWNLQAGVREEARPRPSRTTGVLAIEGLAPYWFHVTASAFVGRGLAGRLEAEYDQLLTQRWIVQPRAELDFSASQDAPRGVRSGLNDVALGLRLRYEVRREFAPYVGINWTRRIGQDSETALVLGLRAWY